MDNQYFGFDWALKLLKDGKRVKRKNWGGYWFIPQISPYVFDWHEEPMNKFICACLKDDGGYVPATPYVEDLLNEDWEEVK